MWTIRNSKELLEHLQSPNFNHITSSKSFDFSTLYATIPHRKLNSRFATITQSSFINKTGNCRYTFLVLCHKGPFLCQGTLRFEKQVYTLKTVSLTCKSFWSTAFSWFSGKSFPTDSRHSNAHKSWPSRSRYTSVLIRGGIHSLPSQLERKSFLSFISFNKTVITYINVHMYVKKIQFSFNFFPQTYIYIPHPCK